MSADPCGCGCCETETGAAPITVTNPPGLPSVGYRIGTYPTFREALVEQLGTSLALRPLTTRDPSDYGLVVLDSWAYLADILTFYSERTVNEAFLRTAKLRDSVVRLAGMVGYEPSPGLAATAPLAFTAQGGVFTLSQGARVQSSPAPGDTTPPVKFETLADAVLTPALSALTVSAPPQPAAPLAAGSTGGLLVPGTSLPRGLSSGLALIAYSTGARTVEHKRVVATTSGPPAASVTFAPALSADADALAVPQSTMRVFGSSAPKTSIYATGLSASGVVALAEATVSFALAASDTIQLDAVYPAIGPGDQVLVVSLPDSYVGVLTVAASQTVAAAIGKTEASVTQLTLSSMLPKFADLHTVDITLLGDSLEFWGEQIPPQITGSTVVGMLDPVSAPLNGQAIIVADATGIVLEANVVATGASPTLAGALEIQFMPGLPTPLDGTSAVLYGNVVTASEGAAVSGELLGSGDASVPGQIFPVAKVPVTYLPQAGAPHGGLSTLVVRVGGVQWTEVPDLYGSGANDTVFVVERADDGSYTVRFGDGVIGARLPSGAQVTAGYRSGLGVEGNVAAGALRLPLTRPTGLVSVFNPVAAGGGADPETLAQARLNAPSTVRTLERIVSLQDFVDQAMENALVAKASASWTQFAAAAGVSLIVAGAAGAQLGDDQLSELRADLDSRRDPNLPLQIQGYVPVALSVRVRVLAGDPDLRPEDVAAAVQTALLNAFSFDAGSFGHTVNQSAVYVAAQSATGVLGVELEGLTLADPSLLASFGLSSDPVQPRIDLAPDQLATLAPNDVTVLSA